MPTSFRGHFLWHELLTSDPEAAKRFYAKVVGWQSVPWMDPSYTIWAIGNAPMAGLMALPADVKAMGVPPHWGSYIGTDDVDATVRQAHTLGAQVLKEATDLPQVGKFAVIKDPQGAAFIAFRPASDGVPSYPAPLGGFSWNELATTDWPAAFTFYSALFGWEKGQGMDMGPMGIYQILHLNGEMIGAMFNKPAEIPVPNWLPYARVKDTAAAAAAVKNAGGQVINGPMDVPGGSIVQLLDPQGAVFAVHAVADEPPARKPTAVKRKTAKTAKAAMKPTKKPSKLGTKKSGGKRAGKKVATRAAKKPSKKAVKPKAAKKPARGRGRAKPRR